MNELESGLGLRDKTLAEFVLNLARQSPSVDAFGALLTAKGAELE